MSGKSGLDESQNVKTQNQDLKKVKTVMPRNPTPTRVNQGRIRKQRGLLSARKSELWGVFRWVARSVIRGLDTAVYPKPPWPMDVFQQPSLHESPGTNVSTMGAVLSLALRSVKLRSDRFKTCSLGRRPV